jgi:hypothetical protein
MARKKYQATWRGARRYQFDEEARLKKADRLRRTSSHFWPLYGLLLIGAAMVAGYAAQIGFTVVSSNLSSAASCAIKGNIAADGERIYHVPGQSYYRETRVNPAWGERWFCSEADARKAGWRRSRV